ncbi:MAG: hypothetical protein JXJ22_14980 [Bacteroidales bacterium]|nr:hypothetical protein [Bacteroidales bacterium]
MIQGRLFYMSGMVFWLMECKSLCTPGWKEVLTNGKSIAAKCESERSHQQIAVCESMHGGVDLRHLLVFTENIPINRYIFSGYSICLSGFYN